LPPSLVARSGRSDAGNGTTTRGPRSGPWNPTSRGRGTLAGQPALV
jgi:hypothetical protein